ncbi:hypothetical protein HHK36_021557 [Tetracentron sinense]|uniref:Uncharacterized protein n=1 Tax=Tetracentron sinense TaxID=13715 RepID=A0A835D7Y1_TETSI|nr:hypothetical protein HHK36_021557 [Tetracentron sinense]
MDHFKMALDCFFAVWFVVGNVWIFGGHSSSSEAPNLYRLCIVFLTFSCIGYAMPFILCATICCCLPCLISILGFREDLTQTRGATPESINALPTYKFKLKKDGNGEGREINSDGAGEGGIVAAGTEKERVISGEDAVCCICLAKYADNDELRELPCSHFFHMECVDKWLKINALCPLCKFEVHESSGGSPSTASPRRHQGEGRVDGGKRNLPACAQNSNGVPFELLRILPLRQQEFACLRSNGVPLHARRRMWIHIAVALACVFPGAFSMSNNLGTEQLSVPNRQIGQMEPMPNNLGLQHLSIPNKQMGQIEPMPNNLGPQQLPIPNKQMRQMVPMLNKPGSQQLLIPNKRMGQLETMPNNLGSQQLLSNKRRALMEPMVMSNNPGSQQLPSPNKRLAQMKPVSNNPGSQQLSAQNKRTAQMVSMSSKPGSQQLSIPNKRTAQMEPSPKGQTESFESVRSKMRESLAASLTLVPEKQNKLPTVGKSSESEAASTLSQSLSQTHEDSLPTESTSTTTLDISSCAVPERPLETPPSKDHDSAQKYNDGQSVPQEIFTNENTEDSTQTWKCDGQEFELKHVFPVEDASFSNSFLIKDELLQGNGLCWVSDFDIEVVETNEIQSAKRPKFENEEVGGDGREPASQSPQTLAVKIEAELFKLYGGVNKKYKEKGRSLLFNLKDRNNPELRERVMSGEISPERLCSMTAEELASEELSQWRIAKAEEFAQMVVLPDSEVDIRRLVKKTHKGEFQVEIEQDDGVSVEVAVGASSLAQIRPKMSETDAQVPSKPNETKNEVDAVRERSNLGEKNSSSNLTTLPHDGTDLMHGLMVDELKDEEFLPPIVSLDEFMQSLDSEPPFENLRVDAGHTITISDENCSDVSKLDSSDLGSLDPVDTAPDKPDKMDEKRTKTVGNKKSSDTCIESELCHPNGASKIEHVWEGLLQLNISSMVTVIGVFKSGEKTSTKEWPSSLEIKGRVRLDAFEKFLQELPMSRNRAIMVVQFCWKEGSPESGRESLCEVVDSYVVDERVGFAEPVAGVELYFCPPHQRIFEMLAKYLPKDQTEALNATDNGIIGVIVWRKAHVTSAISPNSSSHHKHNSKKQHYLRRQQEKDSNNVNTTTVPPLPLVPPPINRVPPSDDEPIDDVPPGFGPAAARDDDDLPEFEFVGGSNPPVPQFLGPNPSRGPVVTPFRPPPPPVEQMRELIHKYGQTETSSNSLKWQHSRSVGVEVQPWNDDDDIPEWQPQPPQQQLPPPPPLPVHSFQQQTLQLQHFAPAQPHHSLQPRGPLAAPLPIPLQPLQQPQQMHMMQGSQQTVAPSWQQGAWWAPPGSGGHSVQGNGLQPSQFGGQPNEGQFYGMPGFGTMPNGMDWRQDGPRSRGF